MNIKQLITGVLACLPVAYGRPSNSLTGVADPSDVVARGLESRAIRNPFRRRLTDAVVFTDGKTDDMAGLYPLINHKFKRIHIVTTAHTDHVKALKHWLTALAMQGILPNAEEYTQYNNKTQMHFYSTKDNTIDITEKDSHLQYLLDPDKHLPGGLESLKRIYSTAEYKEFPHASNTIPNADSELNGVDDLIRRIPEGAEVAVHMIGPTDESHMLNVIRQTKYRLRLFHGIAGFNLRQEMEQNPEREIAMVRKVYNAVNKNHEQAKIIWTNSHFSFTDQGGNSQEVDAFRDRLHPTILANNLRESYFYRKLAQFEEKYGRQEREKDSSFIKLYPDLENVRAPAAGENIWDYSREVIGPLVAAARFNGNKQAAKHFQEYSAAIAEVAGNHQDKQFKELAEKLVRSFEKTDTMEMCDGVHIALVYHFLNRIRHKSRNWFSSSSIVQDVTFVKVGKEPRMVPMTEGSELLGSGLIGMTRDKGKEALTKVMPVNTEHVERLQNLMAS